MITRYNISESAARAAQDANSFTAYVAGSATAEYNRLVTAFEEEVNSLLEVNKRRAYPATAEQIELVEYYADKYSMRLAAAINRVNSIRAQCPSIMIAGGSNFPVGKKKKQNAAMDKFMRESGELFDPFNNYYYHKIKTLLTNTTIYSNDALALEKLQAKLSDLEEAHAEMKARNAYFRKNKTMKGYEGIDDEMAAKIDAAVARAYSWEKQPYPSYALSNSNAEIKRIKDRIAEIEKLKAAAEQPADEKYPQVDGVEVVENSEAMRIQLIFDDKPDEATRTLLKSNGFRWSPSFGAWQRQLTTNGIRATQSVLETLSKGGD